MTLAESLFRLCFRAIGRPREAAETVLSLGVPREALWPLFGLVVVLSVLLSAIGAEIAPPLMPVETGGETGGVAAPSPVSPADIPPLPVAAVVAIAMLGYIAGLSWAGRKLGGSGRFEEALLIVVFLQMILILAQIAELGLLVVSPPMAAFFVLMVMIYAFWLNLNFVDVLHGYGSLMKSFLLILGVSFGLALVLLFVLTLSGVTVSGGQDV